MSIADEDVPGLLADLDEAGGTVWVEVGGCSYRGVPAVTEPELIQGVGVASRGRIESVVVASGSPDVTPGDVVRVNGEDRRVAGSEPIGDGSTTRIDLAQG